MRGVSPPPFHAYGHSHLVVLALTVVVALVMVLGRRRWMELLMIAPVLLSWPLALLSHWLNQDLSMQNALPVQLCDVAAIVGALALWRKAPLACEMVYFFGLAGTLQGLLTPNLQEDFPNPRFIVFFINHCGVVITALYVVLGLRFKPRPWAVLRLMGWLLSWAAVVGAINAALGTNYGFLCSKPPVASLLDVLGPWPWYIGSLVGMATLFFVILDLPFMWGRRASKVDTRSV